MLKRQLKKTMTIILAVAMLFSMTGCGGDGGSGDKGSGSKKADGKREDTKNMTYEGTKLEMDNLQGDPSSILAKDGKLYILTNDWKEKKGDGAGEEDTEEGGEGDTEESSTEEGGEEDTEESSTEEGSEGDTEESSTEEGGEEDTEESSTEEGGEGDTEESSTEEGSEEDVEYENTLRLYVVNTDGSELKEISVPQPGENEYVNNMFINDANEIIFLMSAYNEKTEKNTYSVQKLDETGKEISNEDITEELGVNDSYVSKVILDKKGNLIAVMEQKVVILDENYKKLGELKSDDWMEGAALTKDGQVICGSSNGDGVVVKVVDVENKKWGETIKLEDIRYFNTSDALMNGDETCDFYYKDEAGIYAYSMADKKGTKLVDYLASNINSQNSYNIVPAGKECFIGTNWAEESIEVVRYTKVDPSTIKDKQVITFGSLYGLGDDIRNKAMEFNKENDEYRIEFIDYSDEEDPLTKMNADIVAGNVPDIISMDSLPIEQYAAKGILEDLTPYFDKDEELNTSDIMDSVLNVMQIDGKLYYIAQSFGISTLVANAEVVGDKNGWTFEELKALLNEKGESVRPFYSENKSDMLYSFGTGLTDFVDWQTGECSFDSQDFKDILEICNRGTNEETDYSEDSPSMPSLVKEGKVLFVDGYIGLEELQMYKQMFGGDIAFVGYPNKDKQGSYFQFNNPVGIYSKSKVKDGAWEFIRTFMTKEFQGNNDYMYNTPVRKDCYDMMIKARMATKTYKDEFGNEISPVDSTWGWDDLEVKIKPSTQEEVDMYTDLINNVKRSGTYDNAIMEIIQEEAKAYFAGEKSLDETANIIQNRVKTYVNENR